MNSTDRQVVVTGLGCITALGIGVAPFWEALLAGRSAIGPSQLASRAALEDTPLAEVPNYHAGDHFDTRSLRMLDPISQFSLIAAEEAIQDAGLEFTTELGMRTGIILGNGLGARHTVDETLEALFRDNVPPPPNTIPRALVSGPSSHISMRYGITGPSWMVSTTCASSNHALGQAMELIKCGQVDVVLAGGVETPLTVPTVQAWQALRVLDPVTCRPFTKDRKGLVLSEGAGVIVLESKAHAEQRGAKIHAHMAGFACSSDAYDLTRISKTGATRAMQGALESAGLQANDIDYINAHGTGTQLNDSTETELIHDVFAEHAQKLFVSSTKSMHGHALGATGSFEFIAMVKALQDQCVPPTANFTEAGEGCDLDYVANTSRQARVRAAMSNAFGFGGVNAVVVATEYNET